MVIVVAVTVVVVAEAVIVNHELYYSLLVKLFTGSSMHKHKSL